MKRLNRYAWYALRIVQAFILYFIVANNDTSLQITTSGVAKSGWGDRSSSKA